MYSHIVYIYYLYLLWAHMCVVKVQKHKFHRAHHLSRLIENTYGEGRTGKNHGWASATSITFYVFSKST